MDRMRGHEGRTVRHVRSRRARALRVALAVIATTSATCVGTSALRAQSGAVVLYVNGGRLNPLSGLADGTGDEFKPGSLFGGGLTLMLGRNFALRGHVSRVGTDYRGPTLAVEDSSVTRVSYGGDLMIGWPLELGIAPYLFGGLGAVSIDPADGALESFTKLSGRVGTGFNYLLEGSPLTPFLEVGFLFYSFDRFGFDKAQIDFSVVVGLALAIPY